MKGSRGRKQILENIHFEEMFRLPRNITPSDLDGRIHIRNPDRFIEFEFKSFMVDLAAWLQTGHGEAFCRFNHTRLTPQDTTILVVHGGIAHTYSSHEAFDIESEPVSETVQHVYRSDIVNWWAWPGGVAIRNNGNGFIAANSGADSLERYVTQLIHGEK